VQISLQLWLYLTPVAYPLSAVPEKYRLFFLLNPLTAVVEGLRAVLVFNRAPEWPVVALSGAMIAALLIGSTVMFKRMDKYFADVI
jgi:lipopolysaccharide transport system permease protein